jgi:NADPH-dependent F420 reductase
MGRSEEVATYSIGVVGGTGPQGKGLAYRFAGDGHEVVLGSRSAERAEAAAAEVAGRLPRARVRGATNHDAVAAADVAVLAVPYDGHDELVRDLASVLAGRIVVSCVNPIGFDAQGPFGLPDVAGGSAAEQAAALVPGARVVGAFHHVAAVTLGRREGYLHEEDVLVCGDDRESKEVVMELASCVTGRAGVDAGRLRMARQLEPLTAVLISVNKRYRTRSGIAVSGIPGR